MNKTSIVKRWHDFANDDLITAKYLLGLHPLKLEIICYHCQQSSEKILKAFLISKDIEPPRTHDLRLLRRMCGEIADSFDDIEEACIHLTAYGVQPRYPMEIELTEIDMHQAIKDADHIMNFIFQRLRLLLCETRNDVSQDSL
ncbi:MAG: HEPN domain-containing protein [Syntrophomonadaceae bacterium]|nr:HEPN domain-containing protein [Syntrophomonadaceae bacterium]MDD3898683.1 HEPN domain-containing protein [Syntrophomonadaceae bacterium]